MLNYNNIDRFIRKKALLSEAEGHAESSPGDAMAGGGGRGSEGAIFFHRRKKYF